MRYVMKEKLFDFGDDFVIRDEDGREAFYVDGRVLAIGDKLVFKDRAGRELARIEKKLLSWGTTYEIYRDGRHAATVKKSLFNFLRCTFTVDVPGPGDLEARGDFLDHEYTFTRGDEVWPASPRSGSPGGTPTASISGRARTRSSCWRARW